MTEARPAEPDEVTSPADRCTSLLSTALACIDELPGQPPSPHRDTLGRRARNSPDAIGSALAHPLAGPYPSQVNSPPGGATDVRPKQIHAPRPNPPQVRGVLDYPLAAVLIAGPLVLNFDDRAATVIALVFGAGAAVLAVGTAWSTGIVRVILPLGYADVAVTVAMIVLPFAVGFASRTTALSFT